MNKGLSLGVDTHSSYTYFYMCFLGVFVRFIHLWCLISLEKNINDPNYKSVIARRSCGWTTNFVLEIPKLFGQLVQ